MQRIINTVYKLEREAEEFHAKIDNDILIHNQEFQKMKKDADSRYEQISRRLNRNIKRSDEQIHR